MWPSLVQQLKPYAPHWAKNIENAKTSADIKEHFILDDMRFSIAGDSCIVGESLNLLATEEERESPLEKCTTCYNYYWELYHAFDTYNNEYSDIQKYESLRGYVRHLPHCKVSIKNKKKIGHKLNKYEINY